MSDTDPVEEYLLDMLESYERVSLNEYDKDSLYLTDDDDELTKEAEKILSEGPPDSEEEQLGFILSSLKNEASENPQLFIKRLYDTKKRDLNRRTEAYDADEKAPFLSAFETVRNYSKKEMDIACDWLDEFKSTTDGDSYSQQYHQVVAEELGEHRKMSIDNVKGLSDAVNRYSDLMEICDVGCSIPVALYWTASGDDPRQKDAVSMGFKRSLQEIEGTPFEAFTTHVDMDLRNAVQHGDKFVDMKEECLKIESGAKEYNFQEVEVAVNQALLAIDMIEAIDCYISLLDYRRNLDFLE